MFRVVVVVLTLTQSVLGFVPAVKYEARTSLKPLAENFFLDIAEDPVENTPKALLGEANYRNFVESYNPEGLIVGGPKYKLIERVRQLKLLSLTAESGLLEALESKGVTLSQIEKLLPLADQLNVIPFALANKDLLLNVVAPLIIEPAPVLLPIIVKILNTPSSTFTTAGLALIAGGAFEGIENNLLLGAPLVLLGAPAVVLGAVLGALGTSLPAVPTTISVSSSSTSTPSAPAPTVAASRPTAATRVASVPANANSIASYLTKPKKTIKINSR